mmetsp:Transcript_44788/g.103472  ORF Transcript_44788/g.103472 Transcript_44788/m.103472 type:complete len:465 (-) Transcript_44788:118-1512(-)
MWEADEEEAGAEDGEEAGEEYLEEAPPMFEVSRDGKYVVRLRQQLRTDALAEYFCNQLQEKVDEEKALGQMLVFEDFDISQNTIPIEQWEALFSAIADSNVVVERFRAFGCATMTDEAATFLAGWLAGVTQETVPFELHLSDCAITSDGFHDLAKALEENDAFPPVDPRNPSKRLPLYMRLEHNYIVESVIKRAIDDKIFVPMKKAEGARHSALYKARLLVREDGTFQQKKGTPPAPEDAPPPKPVFEKGKGKGKSKGTSRSARPPFRDRDRERDRDRDRRGRRDFDGGKGYRQMAPPWQALPAPRPTASRPFHGKGEKRRFEAEKPVPAKRYESEYSRGGRGYSPQAYNAFSRRGGSPIGGHNSWEGCWEGGRSARPNRRDNDWDEASSRRCRSNSTPVGHQGAKGPGSRGASRAPTSRAPTPSRPRSAALPFPWEEHWSEEYQLPYFWNSKSGDSSWERPRS